MRGRVPGVAVVGALAALLMVQVLASCGGMGGGSGEAAQVASAGGGPAAGAADDSGGEGGDGADLSREEKALRFAQCMRENGVPMDDPDTGKGGGIKIRSGDGVDRETVQQAQEACQKYAPFGEDGPRANPQMAENMRKFAQCMRDSGVPDFPDPDGGRMMLDKSVADDPDFEAAQEECASKFLPKGKGGLGGAVK
jgi:hypothetical protein